MKIIVKNYASYNMLFSLSNAVPHDVNNKKMTTTIKRDEGEASEDDKKMARVNIRTKGIYFIENATGKIA